MVLLHLNNIIVNEALKAGRNLRPDALPHRRFMCCGLLTGNASLNGFKASLDMGMPATQDSTRVGLGVLHDILRPILKQYPLKANALLCLMSHMRAQSWLVMMGSCLGHASCLESPLGIKPCKMLMGCKAGRACSVHCTQALARDTCPCNHLLPLTSFAGMAEHSPSTHPGTSSEGADKLKPCLNHTCRSNLIFHSIVDDSSSVWSAGC